MKNKTKPNLEKFLNFEYSFTRRRYTKRLIYTWLNFRIIGQSEWQSFGDPWPKIRLRRRELNDALASIAVNHTLKPGMHVHTIVGDGVIIAKPTQPNCVAAQIEGYKTTMPLSPFSIIDVVNV